MIMQFILLIGLSSPDINIIENVWSYIKDELYKDSERLNCANDTWEKIVQIWNKSPLFKNFFKVCLIL